MVSASPASPASPAIPAIQRAEDRQRHRCDAGGFEEVGAGRLVPKPVAAIQMIDAYRIHLTPSNLRLGRLPDDQVAWRAIWSRPPVKPSGPDTPAVGRAHLDIPVGEVSKTILPLPVLNFGAWWVAGICPGLAERPRGGLRKVIGDRPPAE
jgi:hypothetical protein